MLACTDNPDCGPSRRLSGDKVVFKNVQKSYKYPSTITVEYILSPKVKTSSHDYVGIYPRDWKHLTQFVGFEHPISAPFEEPNLYRCLQFICQPPHVTATLNEDYQFVYVNQSQEVLGRSKFFQFVEEFCGDSEQQSQVRDWWSWQDNSITTQTLESVNVENAKLNLTPYEIAYNECFFRNQVSGNEKTKAYQATADEASAESDETSNICFAQQETPSVRYIPEEGVASKVFFKNSRRGRPLVKTRDSGFLEFRNASPESSTTTHRKFTNFMRDQSVNTGPDFNYSSNWLQSKHMQAGLNLSRDDVNRGARPKQCHKCQAPADYYYKQQLMQHELSQAYEQIRDLKSSLDKLNSDLQLSQAAHAKLKVLNDIANKERNDAATLANNLMMSLITQCKPKVTSSDSNMMNVSQELVSPNWVVHRGQPRAVLCGRPNVRVFSGRDKFLKAIIGRQELKIQALHKGLEDAIKIIQHVNLAESKLSMALPDSDKNLTMNSSQMTPQNRSESSIVNEDSILHPSDLKMAQKTTNSEKKDVSLSEMKQVREEIKRTTDIAVCSNGLQSQDSEEGKPWKDALILEPNYYHLDPMHASNREIVSDDDQSMMCSEIEQKSSLNPIETNNNNYDAKNMNSCVKVGESKCAVCEPTLLDSLDITSLHSATDKSD